MSEERVDVTGKVSIVSETRAGWLIQCGDARHFVTKAEAYYDDVDRTLHVNLSIARRWGIVA